MRLSDVKISGFSIRIKDKKINDVVAAIVLGDKRAFTDALKLCPDVDAPVCPGGTTFIQVALINPLRNPAATVVFFVESLLSAGADIRQICPDGDTLLMIEARKYNMKLSVVTALVSAGADPNQENEYGDFPLYAVAKHIQTADDSEIEGYCDVMTYLLQNGADANKTFSATGKTALYALCEILHASEKIVRTLLYYGGDPTIKDNRGETIYDGPNGPLCRALMIEGLLVWIGCFTCPEPDGEAEALYPYQTYEMRNVVVSMGLVNVSLEEFMLRMPHVCSAWKGSDGI